MAKVQGWGEMERARARRMKAVESSARARAARLRLERWRHPLRSAGHAAAAWVWGMR